MKKLELRQIIREEILETLLQQEGSTAAKEAERLGLDYMSFGRWGKNGQVTHKSEKGKLIPVSRDQVQKTTGMNFEKPTSNILHAKRKDGTSRPAADYNPQSGKVTSWNYNSPDDQRRKQNTKNIFADPLQKRATHIDYAKDDRPESPPHERTPSQLTREKAHRYEVIADPYQTKIDDAIYSNTLKPYKTYSMEEFTQLAGISPTVAKFISLKDTLFLKFYDDYVPSFELNKDGSVLINDIARYRDD